MSAEAREFVDTNVLVYAHEPGSGSKHNAARNLIAGLWESGRGAISIQVLQELFVTLTRKSAVHLPATTAADAVSALARWTCHSPVPEDILRAIDLASRTNISFWDAMIMRSATQTGCAIVWSEDLNAGQTYDGVTVRNPFTA